MIGIHNSLGNLTRTSYFLFCVASPANSVNLTISICLSIHAAILANPGNPICLLTRATVPVSPAVPSNPVYLPTRVSILVTPTVPSDPIYSLICVVFPVNPAKVTRLFSSVRGSWSIP
jgi:hypothetical protein